MEERLLNWATVGNHDCAQFCAHPLVRWSAMECLDDFRKYKTSLPVTLHSSSAMLLILRTRPGSGPGDRPGGAYGKLVRNEAVS
jgi:hypothetical protein